MAKRIEAARGAVIAEQAGVVRSVRRRDGTRAVSLRPDILRSAMKAASDFLLEERRSEAAQALPAASADRA